MRKLIVCAAMALTLGMAGLAQAGCTAEEAQQKADLCAGRAGQGAAGPRGVRQGDAGAAARTPPDPAEAGR